MRHVVSQSEVAHLWANKRQNDARNQQGNFYFNGDTIYSYGGHFPIATHYKDVVFFTIRRYSNTTSGHISEASGACSHLDKLYCAHPLAAKLGNHADNIRYWLYLIDQEKISILRARKPEIYIKNIERIVAQMQLYLDYFKLKLDKEQRKAIEIKDKAAYIADAAKRIAEQDKKDAAKLKLGERIYNEYGDLWRSFAPYETIRDHFTSEEKAAGDFYIKKMPDMPIRLRTNGEIVETSKGMKMPIDVAKRYFNFYKRIVAKGGCGGNCGYQMLGYDVKQANADRLIVGCHDIPVSEIDAIAAKLKWN